jgi:uncharacterized protein (TIGR04255 family)
MKSTQKYKNSPLIEAVCEFHFLPSEEWDVTLPGLFYSRIKSDFPIKKYKSNVGILSPNDGQNGASIEVGSLAQFWNSEQNIVIQVGKNFLSINALAPYPAWEVYSPAIISALDHYRLEAKPAGLRRSSLKYINRVIVPELDFSVNEYFTFGIPVPPGIDNVFSDINTVIQFPMNEFSDQLVIQFASLERYPDEPEASTPLLLQLEYKSIKANSVSIDDFPNWLEKGHDCINNSFELSITDKLRSLFR